MSRLELKVPPVVVVLIAAALMWLLAKATPSVAFEMPARKAVVAVLVALGIAIIGAGIAAFRRAQTTVDPRTPEAASSIVRTGIYRWSRNPMYLGFLLILAGWGVALSNGLALLVLPLFVAYISRFQIVPEERALRQRFGADYEAYTASVRRWI
ncbi:MAG TPA: isoprenylcysteine carboxylmethyltransferase family protein [Steroidobacter sp.]